MQIQDPAAGVLVVDDNPTIVTLLGGVLREAGYDVRAATDGARALELAAAAPPELLLLDLGLPGIDGLTVCRRLKADPHTAETPVIVISAADEVDDKIRAFEAGAADYVTKPFEPREVLARVGAHVQLYRLRRELARHNAELQKKNEELEQAERRTRHVFSALSAALPGTVLDGKYRLEEKIGLGGYATVFRAEHLGLRKSVAVKVFRPWEGNDTPQALDRFRREGVAACRVQHKNAVVVMDFGISSTGIAYLVMELLRGRTLRDVVKQDGPLPFARCVDVLGPVCDALAAAHAAGLVHRDIKPDNVFLHEEDGAEIVKVLDFGIARLVAGAEDDPTHPVTRGIVGTPAFLAPERVLGIDYDGKVDVYSVGVMAWILLTGRLPFQLRGESDIVSALIRQVSAPLPPLGRDDVPAGLEALLSKVLAREAAERPTARELGAELRRLGREA